MRVVDQQHHGGVALEALQRFEEHRSHTDRFFRGQRPVPARQEQPLAQACRPEKLIDHSERDQRLPLLAARSQDRGVDLEEELIDQRRLADPGGARDQDRLRLPGPHVAQDLPQCCELGGPADEGIGMLNHGHVLALADG